MAKLVLFVDESCPPCETIKEAYKPYIEAGEVEVMDVREAAMKWPEEFDELEKVPAMGVKSDSGVLIYKGDFGGSVSKPKEVRLKGKEK